MWRSGSDIIGYGKGFHWLAVAAIVPAVTRRGKWLEAAKSIMPRSHGKEKHVKIKIDRGHSQGELMEINKKNHDSIDGYISVFPTKVRKILAGLRAAIKAAAPGAEEKMSYGIPTFVLNGNLVHFAAYKKHIGFYPSPSGIRAFKKELSPYPCSTGTVQFPIDNPLPMALIKKIVEFRVAENNAKFKAK